MSLLPTSILDRLHTIIGQQVVALDPTEMSLVTVDRFLPLDYDPSKDPLPEVVSRKAALTRIEVILEKRRRKAFTAQGFFPSRSKNSIRDLDKEPL
ncbi:hypothetical protein A2841_00510 [Candidatus Kaiserbacteria bacterium RIFCSPHIGHO2_01_FULL_48_10]|uniref:Uncharacterized protein n=1 Tax=Candidatus Kaiserbacteria bacterium RIFCSPHIGHO2_01_FULL_48_10 TaxID=1798476 RepID=A0A1F6C5L9_9BACT|nr:MAG: hypothetical protein A2841_00510 [Candidatus Kaiserbacteria bacterium RIFCSPHIGHO2_01_FULL_48_10]